MVGGGANDRIRELERQLADKDSTINDLISLNRDQLRAKDRQLQAKDRQLEENGQQLQAKDRRLEKAERRLGRMERRLEEAYAEKAVATRRHEDVMRELRFTRETLQRQIAKLERLLQWKSSTSTRNPDHESLTHKFIITAGRKRGVFGAPRRVEDVMLVDPDGTPRDPITKEETPTLRADEFMRVSFLSRQQRTSAQAIHEHGLRGEAPLLQGYMTGGIDFRQNVKTVAKRALRRHQPQQVIDLTSAPAAKKLKR